MTASKTAAGAFARDWDWTIVKDAAATHLVADPATGEATATYTVSVTPSKTDSGAVVSGSVTVTNPNDVAITATVTDALGEVTCPVSPGTVEVPANGSATVSYTCALASGGLYCWGRNDRGQVGDGTGARRTTPVKVPISGATLLAVGNSHACAATDSALYCWGANESGQLGTNDTVDRLSPTVVGVGVPFVALGAFNSSTCGQTSFH